MRSQRVYARGFLHVICHGGEGILSPGISGQTVLRETPPHRQGAESRAGKCMAIGPVAVSGGGSRISVKGVHVDGRERIPLMAVRLWDIANRGRGRRGRGKGTFPRPCLLCLRLNGIRETPPPPGRSAASSRPLPRGRAVSGDSTGYSATKRERDLGEIVHVDGIGVVSSRGSASMGYRPPPGGADGEGMEHPLPLSLAFSVERYL